MTLKDILINIVLMTETNEKRQTGYIYSIRSDQTELIYIGSTFGPLRQRLYRHKYDFKRFNLQKYNYVSMKHSYIFVNRTA